MRSGEPSRCSCASTCAGPAGQAGVRAAQMERDRDLYTRTLPQWFALTRNLRLLLIVSAFGPCQHRLAKIAPKKVSPPPPATKLPLLGPRLALYDCSSSRRDLDFGDLFGRNAPRAIIAKLC